MMKALLQPVYFPEANKRETDDFKKQLVILKKLYQEEAEFLLPISIGENVPAHADAIVFPQIINAAFQKKEIFLSFQLPLIVLTSEFGTVEMWDWEIVAYLRENLNLEVFTPYSQTLAKVILRALAAKRAMKNGLSFLIFQDSPGEGMQANIFKRFYWWEQECIRQIEDRFGVKLIYKSWKGINESAQKIPDTDALLLWEKRAVPAEEISQKSLLNAVKLYLAIKQEVQDLQPIAGIGANCLNESFYSHTTPCLAWNWLFEYDRILWACEGDTVSLISEFIFYSALHRPFLMTNLYPFLVGMAALKHEKIKTFPSVPDSDNHALGVHCGYLGFAPQSFCCQWRLKPKVLEIVDENALMVDCQIETGPVTLAKLHADMKTLTIIEANLEQYVGYPGSDCRNGALIHYKNGNGHKIMEILSSHHAIILQGDATAELVQMAKVYHFQVEIL